MAGLTVAALIEHLKILDPNLPVVYCIHSEQCELEASDICISELCLPRPDGWVHDKRPDKPSQSYVVFP